MGTPVSDPVNIVLDPFFDIAKGAGGNPWFYPAQWDNINTQAVFVQGGAPQRLALQQNLAGIPGGSDYTMSFDIVAIKANGVDTDGFRAEWAGFPIIFFHEEGHYSIHHRTLGAGNILNLRPPTDTGNTGGVTIDNFLIYEQSLTDFVCTQVLNLPSEYTMTETFDLGGGRWMFLFANTVTGFSTWIIYEP